MTSTFRAILSAITTSDGPRVRRPYDVLATQSGHIGIGALSPDVLAAFRAAHPLWWAAGFWLIAWEGFQLWTAPRAHRRAVLVDRLWDTAFYTLGLWGCSGADYLVWLPVTAAVLLAQWHVAQRRWNPSERT